MKPLRNETTRERRLRLWGSKAQRELDALAGATALDADDLRRLAWRAYNEARQRELTIRAQDEA